jgi:hypothetical protein
MENRVTNVSAKVIPSCLLRTRAISLTREVEFQAERTRQQTLENISNWHTLS